jgi:cyanophycinase
VEPDGHAQIVGKGEADFYEASGKPQVWKPGQPLTFHGIQKKAVASGKNFNLSTWKGQSIDSTVSVEKGTVREVTPR